MSLVLREKCELKRYHLHISSVQFIQGLIKTGGLSLYTHPLQTITVLCMTPLSALRLIFQMLKYLTNYKIVTI